MITEPIKGAYSRALVREARRNDEERRMFNLNPPSTPNGIENLTLKFTETAPQTDRAPPLD
jgi:hypothetical protein